MRKKIAAFLGNIIGDLQEKIYRAIISRANELGYDVVAFCTYGLYNDDYLYAEGEKACINLPDFSMFDGVILTEDVFNIDGMPDDLYNILCNEAKCPVVYLRSERDMFYSVLTDNVQGIKSMTEHFIKEHGFKDICYMSGKKEAEEAIERLQGFMEAMEENNIPVTDHMIFHGDFWRGKAVEALNWFMQGREKYPEAIICANDYMAISICEELRNRGIRVPEDVCVSGFDYIQEAKQYQPTITSIVVDFAKMSKKAVNIIDKVNRGEKAKKIVKIEPDLKLHKSCGCGKQLHYDKISELIEKEYHSTNDTENFMQSISEYMVAFEEKDYFAVCEKHSELFKGKNVYLCLCDSNEKDSKDVEKDSLFTDHMILRRVFHRNEKATKLNKRFSRKKILPDMAWEGDAPHNYMIFSVHFKNVIFGYIAAEFPEKDWFNIHSIAAALGLGTAIENALVRKTMTDLENIKSVYQRDILTGIYNRRGFDMNMRDIINSSDGTNALYIASIDMDNLKEINDNLGHLAGDEAIKNIAEALSSVIHDNEICGRIGGDEFQAFLVSDSQDRIDKFVIDLENAIAKFNSDDSKYKIGASVGICGLDETTENSIVECIQKADMRMYENKRLCKKKCHS